MGKYDNKINKDKDEPLDFSKYIEKKSEEEIFKDFMKNVIELGKILELEEMLRRVRIPIIRVRKPPIIKLRFEKLDTSLDPELMKKLGIKPKTDMKIEWE